MPYLLSEMVSQGIDIEYSLGGAYAMKAGNVKTPPIVPMSMPKSIPPKQADSARTKALHPYISGGSVLEVSRRRNWDMTVVDLPCFMDSFFTILWSSVILTAVLTLQRLQKDEENQNVQRDFDHKNEVHQVHALYR